MMIYTIIYVKICQILIEIAREKISFKLKIILIFSIQN